MSKKPNILFIFPDQHRGDAMGCAGHPSVITPNLDRLASEGVSFNRCYTNAPLCMPARASLITGKYVCDHGVWNNVAVADPHHSPSFVRNIKEAGYHTAVIGKTHLWSHSEPTNTREKKTILEDWGFEYVHEMTGPRASIWVDSPHTEYLEKHGALEAYRKYQASHYLHNHTFNAYGDDDIPDKDKCMMSTYGISRPTEATETWVEPPWPLPTEYHNESYVGARAVDWIKDYDEPGPYFLMLGFPGPHDPFDSPQEYRDQYAQKDISAGIEEGPQEPLPDYVQRMLKVSGLNHVDEDRIRSMRVAYYAKITLIDEWVGNIMAALREKGMLDDTWVIYCSDHGEMLGDHRLVHKRVFYEGSARIPCIIRPPSGTRGWQSEALTDLIDISATLLDIAGGNPLPESDGCSLIPKASEGSAAPGADTGKMAVFSEVGGNSMVRTDRYKMVIDTGSREPTELYDMLNDPDERINRVEDPSLKSERQYLLNIMEERLLIHLDPEKLRSSKKALLD
jgi:choline-sulfatase